MDAGNGTVVEITENLVTASFEEVRRNIRFTARFAPFVKLAAHDAEQRRVDGQFCQFPLRSFIGSDESDNAFGDRRRDELRRLTGSAQSSRSIHGEKALTMSCD